MSASDPAKAKATIAVATVPSLPPLPPLPPTPSIRISETSSGGKWANVARIDDADPADPPGRAQQEHRRRIRQALGAVLSSEQLVALIGLGPSAAVGGPKMSDLWKKVRDKDATNFAKIQTKVGDTTPPTSTGDIEALLSKCQALANAPVSADAEVKTFINDAEKVVADACRDFVDSADLSSHEHLLRVLARRPQSKPRTRIFTTNYDLCVERAATNSGAIIVDGFGRESVPVFDGTNFDIDFVRRRIESKGPEFIDGVVHLAKLHGSVDWAIERNQIVRKNQPTAPVIIYPRSDKFELTYRQPFLEMMSQFQSVLRQPSLGLLVIGFGFADAHLSEMILSAVKRNLSLRVVVATLQCEQHCDPANKWLYRPKIHLLQQLIEQGDSRITLLDSSFSDFVRLVPDIGTETEEDRLRSVLRKLIT